MLQWSVCGPNRACRTGGAGHAWTGTGPVRGTPRPEGGIFFSYGGYPGGLFVAARADVLGNDEGSLESIDDDDVTMTIIIVMLCNV